MSRGRLNVMARSITKDVFAIITRVDKTRYKRKLPGRKMIYVWGDDIKRDPENDIEVPGFIVRLSVYRKECDFPSIDAEAGEDESDVIIWLNIHYDPSQPKHLELLYYELRGVIRHELEHLSEIGPLTMMGPQQKETYGEDMPTSGKMLHDINRRRSLFGEKSGGRTGWGNAEFMYAKMSQMGSFLAYVTEYDELGPFVVGFMAQAKASRMPFDEIAAEYLDNFVLYKKLSVEDRNIALKWMILWATDKFPRVVLSGKHNHI